MKQGKKILPRTYPEVLGVVKANTEFLTNGYFCDSVLTVGLNAISCIPEESQYKFCEFAAYVDQCFTIPSKNQTLFHKIPTLVAGSIYIANYLEQVQDYTAEELSILAKYSITQPLEFYKQATSILSKELLNIIASKAPDFYSKDALSFLIDDMHTKGDQYQNIISKFRDSSFKELLHESFVREEKMVEEEMQYANRRF